MFGIQVNHLAWLGVFVSTGVAATIVYFRKHTFKSDPAQNNEQFRTLQKKFIFPYLIILLGESLQAPYIYALFYNLHYTPIQIGVLYVTGLLANVIFSFYCVHLSARYGRKVLCLFALAIGSAACFLKFFNSLLPLLLGRICDGIFATLISAPFQHWYHHEHLISFDFPQEWISSSFALISIGSGFLAVVAGLTSQIVVVISREVVLPYFLSIISFVAGGFVIGTHWSENKPIDAPLPFGGVLKKALGILATSPVSLLLCVTSFCMDTVVQIVVFAWSPVFIKSNKIEHHELSLGVIYGALVSAYLLGLLFHSSRFAQKIPNTKMLILSVVTVLTALILCFGEFPSLSQDWPSVRFDRIFAYLLLLELGIGMYNPSIDALQSSLFPAPQRASLMAFIRLPVSLLTSFAIIVLFPTSAGVHNMFLMAAGLMIFCCSSSIVLHLSLLRKGNISATGHTDHLLIQPRGRSRDEPIENLGVKYSDGFL